MKNKNGLEDTLLLQQIEKDKELAEYLEKKDVGLIFLDCYKIKDIKIHFFLPKTLPKTSTAPITTNRRTSIETFWSNPNNSNKFKAYKPDKCSQNFG